MARALIKLAAMTGDEARASRAKAVLESSADSYRAYGMFAAGYGSAALDRLTPPLVVNVVGGANSQKTHDLREVARRTASPAIHINTIDPETDARRLSSLGQMADERPVAYVCDARECSVRTTEPRELAAALSQSTIASRS